MDNFYSESCVTLAYLEPWYIQNPRRTQNVVMKYIIQILVRRYLDPSQTYCSVFGRQFLPMIFFLNAPSKTIFNACHDLKFADLSIRAAQLVHLFQAYLDISKHYSRTYSRIFRILFIPDILRILVYSYHKAYSDSKVYS